MRYDLVIFDLDGTLLYTLEDIASALNFALDGHGFPTHSLAECKMMIGHGVRNLVKQSIPLETQSNNSVIISVLNAFRVYYTEHIDDATRPYRGIEKLLWTLYLNDVMVAVASNKFQSGTDALMRRFFPRVPFVAVLGGGGLPATGTAEFGMPLKPDPRVVQTILRAAARKRGGDCQNGGGSDSCGIRAVMVGDSETDIQTARNGGIDSIAVTWGYRKAGDLIGADQIFSTPGKLLSYLIG